MKWPHPLSSPGFVVDMTGIIDAPPLRVLLSSTCREFDTLLDERDAKVRARINVGDDHAVRTGGEHRLPHQIHLEK
jgi:hypothetical protein